MNSNVCVNPIHPVNKWRNFDLSTDTTISKPVPLQLSSLQSQTVPLLPMQQKSAKTHVSAIFYAAPIVPVEKQVQDLQTQHINYASELPSEDISQRALAV